MPQLSVHVATMMYICISVCIGAVDTFDICTGTDDEVARLQLAHHDVITRSPLGVLAVATTQTSKVYRCVLGTMVETRRMMIHAWTHTQPRSSAHHTRDHEPTVLQSWPAVPPRYKGPPPLVLDSPTGRHWQQSHDRDVWFTLCLVWYDIGARADSQCERSRACANGM